MADAAPLSPAEATVLLAPNSARGFAAVKATLLLLLTTGVLRIEDTAEPGFFRNKKVAHLRIAAEPKNAPPDVAVLIDLVRAAQPAGGKIKDVVKLAEKAFGPACAHYTLKLVMPALIGRGLLQEHKLLFLRIFRLTPAGAAAQARLKSDLFKAGDVVRLLRTDPAQAAALAATLGTTVLLNDKLTKQFKPLADAMRRHGGTDVPIITDSQHGSFGGSFDFANFDFGSFDLSGFESAAADALQSGLASFESGFSDAGGGHHDGGGGGGGHH